jgi:hypothetical protein
VTLEKLNDRTPFARLNPNVFLHHLLRSTPELHQTGRIHV